MIQTLNHYSRVPRTTVTATASPVVVVAASSKTEEIMSRYRPIAPKPELPAVNSTTTYDGSSGSERIRHSNPYLKSIWANLQARPTRTRKRGRTTISPATSAFKRHRMAATTTAVAVPPPVAVGGVSCGGFTGFCSPSALLPTKSLCLQSYGHDGACITPPPSSHVRHPSSTPSMVTVPLLSSCPMPIPPIPAVHTHHHQQPFILPPQQTPTETNFILAFDDKDNNNNNNNAADRYELHNSEQYKNMLNEINLKLELKMPSLTSTEEHVIIPNPIRPVGSIIYVRSMITGGDLKQEPGVGQVGKKKKKKKRDEVEEEVEVDELPMVITDSRSKVRMANSAYKELVGQPECLWLDLTTTGKRMICGEVMIKFDEEEGGLRALSDGFSCWVKIEWGNDGKKKGWINAFCDVMKVEFESLDYAFAWRFHTKQDDGGGGGSPLRL